MAECKNCNRKLIRRSKERTSDWDKRKFCSNKCVAEFKKLKDIPERSCAVCGKKLILWTTEHIKNKKYCSKSCSNRIAASLKYKDSKLLDRICKNCNKQFKATKYRVDAGYGNFCSKPCANVWYAKNQKRTGIEIKMANLLLELHIAFEEQKRIDDCNCIPDFYIPEKNICLFCDGTYWHSKPRRQFCDKRINKRLEKKGYKVLRFWETDINNNIEMIKKVLEKEIPYASRVAKSG